MTAENTEQPKTPWYKKWWIWVIVAVVVIAGGANAATGADTETPPAASEAPTEETPTAEDLEAERTAKKAEEEAAKEAARAEQEAADAAASAELERAIKDALGVSESFTELLVQDPSLWGGYITGVSAQNANAHITLQISPSDPSRDDIGTRAGNALATLLPATAVENINWIIVEDAAGVVIHQTQPSPLT